MKKCCTWSSLPEEDNLLKHVWVFRSAQFSFTLHVLSYPFCICDSGITMWLSILIVFLKRLSSFEVFLHCFNKFCNFLLLYHVHLSLLFPGYRIVPISSQTPLWVFLQYFALDLLNGKSMFTLQTGFSLKVVVSPYRASQIFFVSLQVIGNVFHSKFSLSFTSITKLL